MGTKLKLKRFVLKVVFVLHKNFTFDIKYYFYVDVDVKQHPLSASGGLNSAAGCLWKNINRFFMFE